MNLYLAGPLFTQAERAWNLRLAGLLTEAGHSVFLPQTEVQAIATLDADAIFRVDVDGVRSADAIVAILDGADPDSGTSFECGLAYALGIPIIAVRTDFRAGGDALPGQKLATINLMLAQASTAVVDRTDPGAGLEALAADLIRVLGSLSEAPAPPVRSRR
ncbi:nucleoside 2-deoxyribosyltransferase [Tundrisphaera lichenicola]|uniref:nucleoside 2-deoxyribosyltransferase n=1 Tax=Tundrisphaera lichenicola TaxID=2029860 RepID=UPI003EB6BD75